MLSRNNVFMTSSYFFSPPSTGILLQNEGKVSDNQELGRVIVLRKDD